ncbi:MAG: hypothetical protein ACOY4O_17780 [Pseudomonadota bacterium]
MVRHLPLYPPVQIRGHIVRSLDEAAYQLRQYAIDHRDDEARRLVHAIRDVRSVLDAEVVEGRLRAWLIATDNERTPRPGGDSKKSVA